MTKMNRYTGLLLLAFFTFTAVHAQKVSGLWKTVDDKTGETKALVQVFTRDGRLYGKIKEVLVRGVENPLCTECEGDRKDRPIKGMTIIDGLEPDGPNQWKGDELLNPEEGRWYRCRIWLDEEAPDVLNVRGYLAFFYRTQNWYRQSD